MVMEEIPTELAPCGLLCLNCPDYMRYPQGFSKTAERMLELLKRHPYSAGCAEKHAKVNPDEFKKALRWFAAQKNLCGGCKAGPIKSSSPLLPGCDPSCPIRTCAKERGVSLCAFCESFPCQHSRHSPKGLRNLMRIQEIGLERWLEDELQRWNEQA